MDIDQLNDTYRVVNGLSRAGLFGPDQLVPEQFFDRARPNLIPEQRLLLACLEDAIVCLQRFCLARNPSGRACFTETLAWFRSNDEAWPCSYLRICEALRIEPGRLRQALERHYAQYETLQATTPRERPFRLRRSLAAAAYTIANVRVERLTAHRTVYHLLALGQLISIRTDRIWRETTAWMPGEVGNLVISAKFAREKGLIEGAPPPRVRLRRQIVGRLDQGVHHYDKPVGRGRRTDLGRAA